MQEPSFGKYDLIHSDYKMKFESSPVGDNAQTTLPARQNSEEKIQVFAWFFMTLSFTE